MSSTFLPPAAWPRVVPFAAFLALLAIRGALPDDAPALLPDWTLSEALYAIQAGLAAALLLMYRRQFVELAVWPRVVSDWLLAVVTGVVVFVLWINLDASWMRLGEPVAGFVPLAADGSIRWDQVAVRIAGAALVVPLIEELFWRSFVMRSIDARDFLARAPAATSALALVGSSIVFALAHDLWLAGIAAGLAYGWLYMRTGNLWFPVAAHAVTNAALGVYVVYGGHWSFW